MTTGKTTIQCSRQIGTLVRRLAGYEGRTMTAMLQRMLEVYVQNVWPDLELVYEAEPEATPKAPARKERRGQGHRDTGKPIPGSAKPGINRRRKKG